MACRLLAVVAFAAGAMDAASAFLARGRGVQAQGAMMRVSMGSAKTAAPFDMNPDTFMTTLNMFNTDLIVLFYSATCPDCERTMPLWSRAAAEFESNQDLTLLSVSDPEGLAPKKFHHNENPAIFFVPRDHKDSPIMFSIKTIHDFTDTDETQQTDASFYSSLMEFARSHLTNQPKQAAAQVVVPGPSAVAAPPPATPAAVAVPQGEPAPIVGIVSDDSRRQKLKEWKAEGSFDYSKEDKLNAKFLAVLRNHKDETLEQQLEVVKSVAYKTLPVAQFILTANKQDLGQDNLMTVAARYLDGEPTARKWAASYAQWFMKAKGRQHAQYKSAAAFREREAEVLEYVLPTYAASVYQQRLKSGE